MNETKRVYLQIDTILLEFPDDGLFAGMNWEASLPGDAVYIEPNFNWQLMFVSQDDEKVILSPYKMETSVSDDPGLLIRCA